MVSGEAKEDGVHHGRLAIEQTYGYLVHDKILYGIISTFNAFVFLKRQNPGILHMSRMIPNNSTPLTIMQILYYFSYLCARHPGPHPETNNEGIAIHLKTAEKDTSKAPKIPNPDNVLSRRTIPPPQNNITPSTSPRRSPRHHTTTPNDLIEQPPSLSLDINSYTKGAYLGCKGWRGTLNTGQIVFAKLWDAWKFSSTDCDHEASVYFHLRDLWGSVVPKFICTGDWGFCHILVLSYIEVSPFSTLF
jgi:hypothetical protein